jgi:hypothetical protein
MEGSMKNHRLVALGVCAGAMLLLSSVAYAQNKKNMNNDEKNNGGWFDITYPIPELAKGRPAPPHDISGMWFPSGKGRGGAVQAGGVDSEPNDGKHPLPYTPYGLKTYQSHHGIEGFDAVAPPQSNDPREKCEPLGFPRANHYQFRQIQIFQDPYKVAVLYEFGSRWRVIWTDGRQLPKLVDGGAVATGNRIREQRYYGYSVGKWVNDTTLVVQTIGTKGQDYVWLDATGRPISDKIRVTETFHRVNYDTMTWTEVIDDPVMYTKPWTTMNLTMKLLNPQTDVMEWDCSPLDIEQYMNLAGTGETFSPDSSAPKK